MLIQIDDGRLVLDLQSEAGKALADMVLQAVYQYGARTNPELSGKVEHLARMVKGEAPMSNMTLAIDNTGEAHGT